MGGWVSAQRLKNETLSQVQIERLKKLGFSWNPHSEDWDFNFNALQKFYNREGHCLVPKGKEEDGLNLGHWVGTQRVNKDRLTTDQLKRLNSLGFSWTARADLWEQKFTALQKFYNREGHCRVAQIHKEDELALGAWVSNQRTRRDRLTPDRLKRLNALGFVWKL